MIRIQIGEGQADFQKEKTDPVAAGWVFKDIKGVEVRNFYQQAGG